MTDNNPDINTFLFIAHPGHELCVHAWLTKTRPQVCVLTDGSGHGSPSRIGSTTKVLQNAGAKPGPIYARFTDRELYAVILERDFESLLNVAGEFAEAIISEHVTSVAGDAIEGYNPAHDICRLIINAGVRIARHRSTWPIFNSDFLLVGRHVPSINGGGTSWQLSDVAFRKKLEAARNFPELQPELQAIFTGHLRALQEYPQLDRELLFERNTVGSEAYSVEAFREVDDDVFPDQFLRIPPFYERYGEHRVADGHYRHVIRYREHIRPLAEALAESADSF